MSTALKVGAGVVVGVVGMVGYFAWSFRNFMR